MPVPSNGDLVAYLREYEEDKFLVVINLGTSKENFAPDREWKGTVAISTQEELEGKKLNNKVTLAANQGLLIKLE